MKPFDFDEALKAYEAFCGREFITRNGSEARGVTLYEDLTVDGCHRRVTAEVQNTFGEWEDMNFNGNGRLWGDDAESPYDLFFFEEGDKYRDPIRFRVEYEDELRYGRYAPIRMEEER